MGAGEYHRPGFCPLPLHPGCFHTGGPSLPGTFGPGFRGNCPIWKAPLPAGRRAGGPPGVHGKQRGNLRHRLLDGRKGTKRGAEALPHLSAGRNSVGQTKRKSRVSPCGHPAQPAHCGVWSIRDRQIPGADPPGAVRHYRAGGNPPSSPTVRASFTPTQRSCSAAMAMRCRCSTW